MSSIETAVQQFSNSLYSHYGRVASVYSIHLGEDFLYRVTKDYQTDPKRRREPIHQLTSEVLGIHCGSSGHSGPIKLLAEPGSGRRVMVSTRSFLEAEKAADTLFAARQPGDVTPWVVLLQEALLGGP